MEVFKHEVRYPGMKEYGPMFGPSFQYLLDGRFNSALSGQLRVRLNYMTSTNKGIKIEDSSYKTTKNYTDFVVALGLEARLGSVFSVAPYMGVGQRDLSDESDYYGEYDSKVSYTYLPIGADWKLSLPHGWGVAFNTELDVVLDGKNTTYQDNTQSYGNAYYGWYDKDEWSTDLDSGYGLRLSAKGEKNFGKVGIFVEPFYRYWNVDKSDKWTGYKSGSGTVYWTCYTPKHSTREFGIRFGVSF
jgi:hypothetical protein